MQLESKCGSYLAAQLRQIQVLRPVAPAVVVLSSFFFCNKKPPSIVKLILSNKLAKEIMLHNNKKMKGLHKSQKT